MTDALTWLIRPFITVLPVLYLCFAIRTSWRTGSKRFLPVSVANLLALWLIWLSGLLSDNLTVWDGLVPTTALVLAVIYLSYLYTGTWWRARQRRY
jgi:hypothetical protein